MPGLYLHIPFCERKCVYCDFYSVESMEHYDAFVDRLCEEIVLRTRDVSSAVRFGSVFFGGGTPSLLDDRMIGAILDTLRRTVTLADDAEITMECNPGTVTAASLRGYRDAGVNRLSFGVQSFHDDDLRFLSRIHSADEARRALRLAHRAGFENVNLDLMFSLPGQSPERWLYNLEQARALDSTHLSCYSLTVEAGTPLARMVRHGLVTMPPAESDAALFEMTMETLHAWGFAQYEVSNYCLPGFTCRHNLTYWRHEDYLGFGPSAHGTWEGRRWWNVSSIRSWLDALRRGALPEAGGELLTPAVQRNEYVYLRLRSEGIDLREYSRLFGHDLREQRRSFLDRCVDAGYIRIADESIRLTRAGMLLCDALCAELIA